MITDRPWGTYEVLTASETHQVKRIVVHPGKRLSYQTHEQRSEYWVIVAGTGTVTLDGIQSMALGGDAFSIEQGIAQAIEDQIENMMPPVDEVDIAVYHTLTWAAGVARGNNEAL